MKAQVRKKRTVIENQCRDQCGVSKEQENTYSIFTYIKKNLGAFAGAGAVIIAILSALISFCSYMYEGAKLRYWGVDSVFINLSTANTLYGTVASVILLCAFFVSFFVLDMIADKSTPIRKNKVYLKSIKKEYRKEIFRVHIQNFISSFLRKPNDNSLVNHANRARMMISKLEVAIRKEHKAVCGQILSHFLLLEAVLTLTTYVWLSSGALELSGDVVLTLISAAGASAFYLGLMAFSVRIPLANKKEIRKEACQHYSNLAMRTEVPEVVFPLKKLLSGDYSIKQPDYKIKRAASRFVVLTVFLIAALIVFFQFLGYEKAESQTVFQIVSEDGKEYAVLYNNGENVVVARCSSAGDVLTIDTELLKVRSIEGLAYRICQFAEIKRGSVPDSLWAASDIQNSIYKELSLSEQ